MISCRCCITKPGPKISSYIIQRLINLLFFFYRYYSFIYCLLTACLTISIFSPQNAISILLNSSSNRIDSNASINLSNVQPSLNLFNNKNATTLVDMIGVDWDESESGYKNNIQISKKLFYKRVERIEKVHYILI